MGAAGIFIAWAPEHAGLERQDDEVAQIFGQIAQGSLGSGNTHDAAICQVGIKVDLVAFPLVKVRVQYLTQILVGNQLGNLGADTGSVFVDLAAFREVVVEEPGCNICVLLGLGICSGGDFGKSVDQIPALSAGVLQQLTKSNQGGVLSFYPLVGVQPL